MERNPVTVTAGRAGSTDSSDQEEKKSLASAADYMRNFKNIIAPGNEASMTREFNPQVAYEFEKYLNPQKLKQHVLKSEKLRSILEHYAKELGQPVKQLERQAKAIIDEIGLERNMAIIRWCGIAITAIGKRICDGFYVNSASMANVRKDMGKCPVLYLPSHRSYMDFILMSYICYYYDIEIPGIAAGMGMFSRISKAISHTKSSVQIIVVLLEIKGHIRKVFFKFKLLLKQKNLYLLKLQRYLKKQTYLLFTDLF